MTDCIPVFHWVAKKNGKASAQEGRPIFDKVPFVQILVPGQNLDIPDRPVQDEDKSRWPDQWKAFVNKSNPVEKGTPIEEWPALDVSQVAQLKAINVFTVEQLADLPDSGIQRIGPGGRSLQNKAKAYIESAKGDSDMYAAIEENDKLKEELSLLKDELKEVKALVERQQIKKKRGRPRKSA